MKHTCRIDLVIVIALALIVLLTIPLVFFYGTRSGAEHIAPIPAIICSGFIGFIGRNAGTTKPTTDETKTNTTGSTPESSDGP